mmetsp:Transcript_22827/g.52594  ORF Transcript_22827/g.52594 Transcript_22827/m.52594 type:complete len:459 (-) Transcript_22827:96-1472(-)|eukprot:CAMPEP_0119362564 /NCGR_PEP_ID=MMETSP1334-20130426/9587_1 /TAXON_ID=127549 /ORGANISM="Calcidiscus leptoporus, Strain RCC1130" /LENGTH=458 /DNA_ID=CAMNT_0007377785 /DNA_START=203 /DNA_END=1579 /DNA_ORIENTATION=-
MVSSTASSRILLVVDRFRADRWDVIEGYRRHFAGVVLIADGADYFQCLRLVRTVGAHCKSHRRDLFAGDRYREFGSVVRQMLGQLHEWRSASAHAANKKQPEMWLRTLVDSVGRAPLERIAGFLYMHMDFWVSPRKFFDGLNTSLVWRLGPGLARSDWGSGSLRGMSIEALRNLEVRRNGKLLGVLARGERAVVHELSGVRFTADRGWVAPSSMLLRSTIQATVGLASPQTATAATTLHGHRRARETKGSDGDGGGAALGVVSESLLSPTPSFALRGHFAAGQCYNASALAAEHSWAWGYGSKHSGAQAMASLSNEHLAGASSSVRHEVCAGWSDLYYVPLGQAVQFVALASHFGAHRVFHEVAVPSMLNLLAQRGGSALSPAQNTITTCFGCCCCTAVRGELDPHALLRQYPCGHRLGLQDGQARGALQQLLIANTSARTNCTLVQLDGKLKYMRCT